MEGKAQKFHPTFKISSDTRWTNGFLIECLLKEGSNPRFCPSLRDFMDNYNQVHISNLVMVSNLPTLRIVGWEGWGLMLPLDGILICN